MGKYNFHLLGWKNFENLIGHIMQKVLGETYTTFAEGSDGGIDGYFEGNGNGSNPDIPLRGKFVFQCKFTSEPSNSMTCSIMDKEIPKVKKLVDNYSIQHYIVFTNRKLTAENRMKIQNKFKTETGITTCLIFGKEWIEQTIDANKILRQFVPRLYGIGDLSEIINERVYQQSISVIEELKEQVSTFVVTNSYRNAVESINENNFVILLGRPATGKTAIATNIAMTSIIEEESTETLILENPSDFKKHWNPNNPNQLFWFDDVFGSTNLDYGLVSEWESVFPKLQAAINKGSRVIFTSRDYIFRDAQGKFKRGIFPLLYESQVIIDVQKLDIVEKQQILYNHIKSGNLTKKVKTALKPFLNDLSLHKDFTPELARRLGNKAFHKKLHITKPSLHAFFSNPSEFFEEVIENLNKQKQGAMILILIHNNKLSSPVQESDLNETLKLVYDISLPQIRGALESMKDSLVKTSMVQNGRYWSLYHPSMIDSLHNILSSKSEMLDLYIVTAKPNILLRDTSFKRDTTKIFIPHSQWSKFTDKIISKLTEDDVWSISLYIDNVSDFLVNEGSEEYLNWLVQSQKEFIERLIKPQYLQFRHNSAFRLSHRLEEIGLLENEQLLRRQSEIYSIAINNKDLSFLEDKSLLYLIGEEGKNKIIDDLILEGPDNLYEKFTDIVDNEVHEEMDQYDIESYFEDWLYTTNFLIDYLEKEDYDGDFVYEYENILDYASEKIETLINDINDSAISEHNDFELSNINIEKTDDIFSDVDE